MHENEDFKEMNPLTAGAILGGIAAVIALVTGHPDAVINLGVAGFIGGFVAEAALMSTTPRRRR